MDLKNSIKVLFFLIALLFIYSLVQRPPDIDDAWLGEHAYWQAKLGYVKSELMHGITQQETRFLCHHKLLTLQGALFIQVAGFSVYSLKSLSLVYFLVFIYIFYSYAYKKLLTPLEFWFSLLLLISNALVFQFADVFRPEIPVMTLGFVSYIFVEKTLKPGRNTLLLASVGGLFAGLCVATHLNGIVFPIAGFLLLIWNRKFLHGLIFGLSTIPAVSIYFYDFTAKYNLRFWLYQLNETPSHDRISNLPYGLTYLNNLLNEHLRFFHGPLEISFTILFIVSIIFLYRHLKIHRNLIRYTILLAISLAIFSVHKSSKYMIIYLPYLILLVSPVITKLFYEKDKGQILFGKLTYGNARIIMSCIIIAYLSVNIYFDIQIATKKYQPEAFEQLVDTYVDVSAGQSGIVAPMEFIFYGMDRFKSIQSELCYTEMQKSNPSIYGKDFLNLASSYEREYIILSEKFIGELGMDKITAIELLECNYEILYRDKTLMILKKIKQAKI
jgi:hypothetical protein